MPHDLRTQRHKRRYGGKWTVRRNEEKQIRDNKLKKRDKKQRLLPPVNYYRYIRLYKCIEMGIKQIPAMHQHEPFCLILLSDSPMELYQFQFFRGTMVWPGSVVELSYRSFAGLIYKMYINLQNSNFLNKLNACTYFLSIHLYSIRKKNMS